MNYLDNIEKRKKSDQETISLLLKHGASLDKEYLIDFFFVGTKNKLKKIEEILLDQGYKKPLIQKEGELFVQQVIKLNLMGEHLITESLEILAKENNVSFDGWGTVAN